MKAVIRVEDLKAAIAECQGERNPNANTCMKLAAYYIILKELEPDAVSGYSKSPAPVNEKVGYYSETEFGKAINNKDMVSVLELMDELAMTVQVLQPRLYNGLMRKIHEL